MSGLDRVYNALEDLGDTEGDVVTTLLNKGYKGKQGTTDNCPVANYLRGETGILVFVDTDECGTDEGTISTTRSVCAFIEAFDGGLYPELESVDD